MIAKSKRILSPEKYKRQLFYNLYLKAPTQFAAITDFIYSCSFQHAMPEEPFMLVSLEEAKAKKLASVLNNETCTKILNWLSSHKEGTESEIAKKLKLPLSTVHYNLKQLVEAKLVIADEYHYSEKGREVNHYKLANKYIIIAPQEEQGGFLDKLKQFIPAALIVAGTGVVLKALNLLTGTTGSSKSTVNTIEPASMERAMPEGGAMLKSFAMEESAMVADMALAEAPASLPPPPAPPQLCEFIPATQEPFFSNTLIITFVVGGLFAIFLIALFTYLRKKK
jgi:DNA-binding transcriptional ArsR family regulator